MSVQYPTLGQLEKSQAPDTENAVVAVTVTTADQSLGAKNITVNIPPGAEIVSVIAVTRINIMNNSATAQKIDLKFDVEGVTLFDQSDVPPRRCNRGISSPPTARS